MIRLLNEADDQACQRLLLQKPAENLFIIGDIENFGYDTDFQRVWGYFDEALELTAVLLKYRSNYICYADGPFDAEGFGKIINQDPEFRELSGLESMTSEIIPYIEHPKKHSRTLYYAKCEKLEPFSYSDKDCEVKLATLSDVPLIADLHNQISEFEESENREDSIRSGMENQSARTYYIKRGNQLVSSASTTAENSVSAMVVGVCTHPNYEQQGYASLCMNQLCKDLLTEGKTLCLFYDNPSAGRIYKRLGFEDIGHWMMHLYDPVPVQNAAPTD
ncbi:GNAT family N-acetyltransferase [Halobacillus locisalis]|uniref:GNAT family N-acetyltransferase n=1 Tax=Halobacillus locisalis TaxID=220753 RepID=A0A838CXH2_9BACI|nr:GNAT family N-acetyltransferase [Halobacillus locisalis]MBA2176529.1 GNAT family N-acetyltransferase [Halobacillus locisalis]